MNPKIRSLSSAIAIVTLAAVPFGAARAVILTTGCGDPGVCEMSELLAGGTIQIDDKLFHNFRNYVSIPGGGASAIDPDEIHVTDYKTFGGFGIDPAEIGLIYFELVGNSLIGGQSLSTSWSYTVQSLGAPIVDNTLLMSGGGFADVDNGASAIVREGVMDVTGFQVVSKEVFEDTRGLQTQDHQDFGPHAVLDINTQMVMNGGDPADPTINTQLLFLVQTFSQQVPEPGTLGLLGICLAALGFGRRRSTR